MKELLNKWYKNHALVYKILLFLLTTLFIVYLFPKTGKFRYSFEKGKPWQYENLYAPFSFTIKKDLEKDFIIDFDTRGSIGKRYLRSSTAGTPYAITIDYESLEKEDATLRDRDTEKQVRIKIRNLKEILRKLTLEDIKFSELK